MRPRRGNRRVLMRLAAGRQWGAQACFLASALNRREGYTDWLLSRLLPFGNMVLLNPSYMDFSRVSPVLRARIDFGLDRDPVEWYALETLLYGAYVRDDGSVELALTGTRAGAAASPAQPA